MTYLGHHVFQTLIRCDFSPVASTGGQYVFSGSHSGQVVIYDVSTSLLWTRCAGPLICVYQAVTGEKASVLSGHHGIVRGAFCGRVDAMRFAAVLTPLRVIFAQT